MVKGMKGFLCADRHRRGGPLGLETGSHMAGTQAKCVNPEEILQVIFIYSNA